MICPFATVKLLSANATHPRMTPTAVVLHSQGGHGPLHDFFEQRGLQAHFWVAEDGRIEQYMDTEVQAWHAFTANHFGVGIESESTVTATEPWAPAQLASIIRVVDWVCTTHGIPREIAPTDHGPGIGWHAEFPAWNQSAHACPGPARVDQIHNQIIPALQGPIPSPGGFLMALSDAEQAELLAKTRENYLLLKQQQADTRQWVGHTLGWVREIGAKLGVAQKDAAANDPTHT